MPKRGIADKRGVTSAVLILALSASGAFWGLAATALGICGLVVAARRFRTQPLDDDAEPAAPRKPAKAPPRAAAGPTVREFCLALNRVLNIRDALDERGQPRMPEASFIYGLLDLLRDSHARRATLEQRCESLAHRCERLAIDSTAAREELASIRHDLECSRVDTEAMPQRTDAVAPPPDEVPRDLDEALRRAAEVTPAAAAESFDEPAAASRGAPAAPPGVGNAADFHRLLERADALHSALTLQTVKLESALPDARVLIEQVDDRLRRLTAAMLPPAAVEQAGAAVDESTRADLSAAIDRLEQTAQSIHELSQEAHSAAGGEAPQPRALE